MNINKTKLHKYRIISKPVMHNNSTYSSGYHDPWPTDGFHQYIPCGKVSWKSDNTWLSYRPNKNVERFVIRIAHMSILLGWAKIGLKWNVIRRFDVICMSWNIIIMFKRTNMFWKLIWSGIKVRKVILCVLERLSEL